MKKAKFHNAAVLMVSEGGSFDEFLAKAYLVGDQENRERIEKTFSDRFAMYAAKLKELKSA